MAQNWGPGVSRVLSAFARQFQAVVWQRGMPPLDSELNLSQQIDQEKLADLLRGQVDSGFFIDPTRAVEDYRCDPLYANQFLLAPAATVDGVEEAAPVLLAAVNGWIVPVAGTAFPENPGDPDGVANRIRLYPPPTTGGRIDLVFLEVWQSLLAPNPSTLHKPTADTLWKYGNREYGGNNEPDDLEDPAIAFQTTKRIQLQYRIRVVGSGDALGTSIDLSNYPDGLNDPQVRGCGNAYPTLTGFTFENMRSELGDATLWRAGDGDPANALQTVDGYVYAVPICAVFRRNAAPFTATANAGAPNQNGATDRTPSSHSLPNPRDGATTLTQAKLAAGLAPGAVGWVTCTDLAGSGLLDPDLFPIGTSRRYVSVGEGVERELVALDPNTDPGGHPSDVFIDTQGRGRGATPDKYHRAGAPLRLFNSCPEGLYADEIAPEDILDLRRAVNMGEWDYQRLLQHAVSAVAQGSLRTTFKQSGSGGDSIGPVVLEVSRLQAPTAVPFPAPQQQELLDGPDGLRTIWSDSAAVQRDVNVILDPAAPLAANGTTATTFDVSAAANWGVGADFQPSGFLNAQGTNAGWTNGSTVFVHLGGANGTGGARAGLVGAQRSVRFMSPAEMWLPYPATGAQQPWKLRFLGGPTGNDAGTGPYTANNNAYRAGRFTAPPGYGETLSDHPGPMYPTRETNFERPFIVLGGVLNPALYVAGVAAVAANFVSPISPGLPGEIHLPGFDFNAFALPLGRDGRSLADYLTANGTDYTGNSSQLYLVVYGDPLSRDNNGAFQVLGAGTAGYTQVNATSATGLMVRPLSSDFNAFNDSVGSTVTVEFRSQEINAEDDNGLAAPPAGLAVVFTDLAHTDPWGAVGSGFVLEDDGALPSRLVPVYSKAVLTMDVMWYPNRGAVARVPTAVASFANLAPAATMVRTVVSAVDSSFATEAPYPEGQVVYPGTQVQLWNRLPQKGLWAPYAPANGGAVVGLTEQDREAELFVDVGSKTAVYRPFTLKPMTTKGFKTTASPSLVGPTTYGGGGIPVDGAGIFTSGLLTGYVVPPEYMPCFGRQDIPYHVRTGTLDPVYPGINHLFSDRASPADPTFYIVGGEDNLGPAGTPLVNPMLMGTTLPYAQRGTLGGAPHPAYGARKCYYPDVVSSDLGVGMRGVELPPYLGVARVYGVYEVNDFLAHLDPSFIGGFQSDRLTPIVDPPTNLLRLGADKQTLFIRKGGANAFTGLTSSHTYVVPESALDITLIPGYVPANAFDDFNYVVECVVFGFGEGFIDQNNLVLARRHSGTAVAVAEGANRELVGVTMVLPCAASRGDALSVVSSRTVYQGDPYMTRDGSVIAPNDYTARYGQIPQSDAYLLDTPIEQFNTLTGVMTVERPNPRALQVLASLDLYTTLGTGKIGGLMWPGTDLDCGYTDPAAGAAGRIPSSALALPWRVLPRAYTAGQVANDAHAAIGLQLIGYALVRTHPKLRVTLGGPGFGSKDLVGGTDYDGATLAEVAASLASAINAEATLSQWVSALAFGDRVVITALNPGAAGNALTLSLTQALTPALPAEGLDRIARIVDGTGAGAYPTAATFPVGGAVTSAHFKGGADLPVNAGSGDTMVSLTGVTDRFPLGILVSDSDFIGENMLGGRATSLRSYVGSIRSVYETLPLTGTGQEYTRFVGDPGSLLSMSDGAILRYTPYTVGTPTGTKRFRIFRGGGAAFVLSGAAPGGPISWVSESFSAALRPVLKGAALAVKALLVRNYPEDAFSGGAPNRERSQGSELQMVLLTQAIYGTPSSTAAGVSLQGVISPTGYGEGYAAADRYLLPGRPTLKSRNNRHPDPALQPAPYLKP